MEDRIPGGLQHCHKTCCEKGGRRGRRTYRVQRWHHHGDVVFQTGGLAYDMKKPMPPSLLMLLKECYNPLIFSMTYPYFQATSNQILPSKSDIIVIWIDI